MNTCKDRVFAKPGLKVWKIAVSRFVTVILKEIKPYTVSGAFYFILNTIAISFGSFLGFSISR